MIRSLDPVHDATHDVAAERPSPRFVRPQPARDEPERAFTLAIRGRAPELSVVVPCFDEEEVIDELHRRLSTVCQQVGLDYEIVLVNDGSRDGTWIRMLALADADPRLVLVNLARNHGHQLALTAGLSVCRGESVLIIDADLQDPPELLPEMLSVLNQGADVVYGRRRRREGESLFKRVSASLFYRLIDKLTDAPIPQDTGDFRLINRRVLDVLLAMPERHRFIRGMVSWVGFRQEAIEYDRHARFAGTSKYPLHAMIRFALDAITSFSIKPLRLAYCFAFALGMIGMLLLTVAGVAWYMGASSGSGLAMVAAMLLVGGLNLGTLGIFGEYLGRMYEQVLDRPLFLIERVVHSGTAVKVGARSRERAA